jgi:hypothetical protein
MTATPSNERRQYVALGALSLAVTGLMGILFLFRGTLFEPYFGSIPPLAAIALVILVGVVSLGFLRSRGWFEIYMGDSFRGMAFSATVATLFGIGQVLADLVIHFPKDLNVPPPESLAFYPVMAYVVEASFHALPLALLLAVLGPLSKKVNTNVLVWMCFLLVSCLEPIVMMRLGFSAYVGLFVFAFNLFQLYVFRRYDFVSMYSFRCVYYMDWHIVWGYLRLRWLF